MVRERKRVGIKIGRDRCKIVAKGERRVRRQRDNAHPTTMLFSVQKSLRIHRSMKRIWGGYSTKGAFDDQVGSVRLAKHGMELGWKGNWHFLTRGGGLKHWRSSKDTRMLGHRGEKRVRSGRRSRRVELAPCQRQESPKRPIHNDPVSRV